MPTYGLLEFYMMTPLYLKSQDRPALLPNFANCASTMWRRHQIPCCKDFFTSDLSADMKSSPNMIIINTSQWRRQNFCPRGHRRVTHGFRSSWWQSHPEVKAIWRYVCKNEYGWSCFSTDCHSNCNQFFKMRDRPISTNKNRPYLLQTSNDFDGLTSS